MKVSDFGLKWLLGDPEQARRDAIDQRANLYSLVVRRALQSQPEQRYQRASEMRADLRRAGCGRNQECWGNRRSRPVK